MLETTMKPFGAAAVFLAVINLLTVSSSTNVTETTNLQTPGLQDPTTYLTSTPSLPRTSTGPGKHESSLTTISSLPGTKEDTSNTSTSTSKTTTISTVFRPTVKIPKENTTDSSKKEVHGSTVASDQTSSAPPKVQTTKAPIIDVQTTTPSKQVASTEASTTPSGGTQIINAVDNQEDSKKDKSNDSSADAKKSNKGIKIAAGCVAAGIAVIVLVVICKICQKKPPAAENAEVKASVETKENVKLVSVKIPNSDMKRTSSDQM